jgi:NAD(P)-dependent dehydrogenase (short-subunit alcohol dehydrogenase family)
MVFAPVTQRGLRIYETPQTSAGVARHQHSTRAEQRAALGEIRTAFGPAAVLVNNAANDQRYEFDQITPEQFDRTIAVNFRHVFFAAQAIVPQMRELGYGSIVNMSSVSWMRGIPLLEAYASAKAAAAMHQDERCHSFLPS